MTILKTISKLLTGAALAGALLLAAPHKAEAQRIGFGISIGGPAYYGGYYGRPYPMLTATPTMPAMVQRITAAATIAVVTAAGTIVAATAADIAVATVVVTLAAAATVVDMAAGSAVVVAAVAGNA